MAIYSPQIERHCLAGLLKYPKIFAEIDSFINESDFFHTLNSTVYVVVRRLLLQGEQHLDKVLVGQTIQNLSISFEDNINIFDYLESLSIIQINEKAAIESFKELKKITIAREIEQTAIKVAETMKTSLNLSPADIISAADKIYNAKISLYQFSEQPQDLFEGLNDLLEERGNAPREETGYQTPYHEFNNLYGGLRGGNLYAIVSRPQEGKTTWISDICLKSTILNKGLKCLILDTEMFTVDIKFRIATAITDVPMWYLETGNWRKNAEMLDKVRNNKDKIESLKSKVKHLYVAGKPIEEITSIIRRWYYSEVGRGNPAIVAYDYIKLTGEKVTNDWKEYQIIGEKVDTLKKLGAELNIPIITACQLNRSGEGNQRVDDSSAIAQSDRLQWFASFVAIFRRKTIEEINDYGLEFGNHILKPVKTRFQGKDAPGHHDLVRIPEGEGFVYRQNFINYDVTNFNVNEKGSLKQMIERRNRPANIVTNQQPAGNLI